MKVVSKHTQGGSGAYLCKGWVIDVYRGGVCSVRLDKGQLCEGVKQRQVETVLPSPGDRCMVYTYVTETMCNHRVSKSVYQRTSSVLEFSGFIQLE